MDQTDVLSNSNTSDSEQDAMSVLSHSGHHKDSFTCVYENGLLDCGQCSGVFK